MHVETHNTGEWLMVHNDGHTYMGVPGFRVFHGQQARPFSDEPGEGAWRVQGGEGTTLTARNGWFCPEDTGYWWVGLPINTGGGGSPALSQLLQDWGRRLWRDGYTSRLGQRLIIEPPNGASPQEELDPENPGYIVRPPHGWTTAVGEGGSPYDVNFLIDGTSYQFYTEPHP